MGCEPDAEDVEDGEIVILTDLLRFERTDARRDGPLLVEAPACSSTFESLR
jgi:hypothetical protein